MVVKHRVRCRARDWPARRSPRAACALALEVAFELLLGRQILFRPGLRDIADARSLHERPGRVGQVRPADGAQVGAAGSDDAVDMIGLGDRADGDGRNASLVADAVGKRRLVHAAISGPLLRAHLPRRAVDHVGTGRLEGARDLDRVVGRDAARRPVVRRDAHRHRQVLRPDFAQRGKHLERIAQAVGEAAAVGVATVIGEW
jgi:hypothetical protein